ncbi:MAG: multi-sensor signal transduction histidine kinase [Myxococcaceae bacterium]|nr:multi-sensor signal transduction histidine kinase [Myxococcaceae bacterium]
MSALSSFRLGIRGKLFAISLGLIGLAALTSGVLVETVMRTLLVERVGEELTRVAAVAAQTLALVERPLLQGSEQPLVQRLGQAAHARVTVLAADGRVLGDSALTLAELAHTQSHADRPEVQRALASGRGTASRFSETMNAQMMYVAVPFKRLEQRGLVRIAMSLQDVDALISHMRWLITGAVLIGLAIAAGMGGIASYLASRSLMQLVTRARALASGARGERISLPDSDELGGLAGSFNHMADELDRTMRALGHERDRVHAILESLTDAVLALDGKAGISEMNGAALALLHVERVPSGTPLIDVIRVPALLEIVSSAQRGETAHAEFFWPGPPRRTLLATAAPQRDNATSVLVLRDVTELRRLETMRRDFVANASHELRTPVSIISANVETLLGGALSDPQRAEEFLNAVQRNAERLSRLVTELLDLSRIEADSHELDLKPMTAEAAVGAVIDLLETRAHDRGLELDLAVEDDLEFIGEARSFEQVLVNLVDNAIKYTPRGGTVGIEIRRDADHALFEVWDTGPGVPETHRARLFERFYRVDPGRSRDMGGTGLGLSIVKHLVEAMRGSVGMKPRRDRGSIFWVRLPLAHTEADEQRASSRPSFV